MIFQEIGKLQEDLVPDPNKEISFDSLVEQYKEHAKKICLELGKPECDWKLLASTWADVDINIIQTICFAQKCSPKIALTKFLNIKVTETIDIKVTETIDTQFQEVPNTKNTPRIYIPSFEVDDEP